VKLFGNKTQVENELAVAKEVGIVPVILLSPTSKTVQPAHPPGNGPSNSFPLTSNSMILVKLASETGREPDNLFCSK